MKILNLVKTVSPDTFEPKLTVIMELDLKRMQDVLIDKEKLLSRFGSEFFQKVDAFTPKRPEGNAFFTVKDGPVFQEEYITNDDSSFSVRLEARTYKISTSLEEWTAQFGKNLDVFIHSIQSDIIVNPDTLKREYVTLVRLAVVTEEYRKKNNLRLHVKKELF